MTDRRTSRFSTALDEDARLAAAIQRLSAAALTGERPTAERAARAAALAAGCRALGCMVRDRLAWPRAAAQTPRPTAPAAPGA
jgi:hypothetical protein